MTTSSNPICRRALRRRSQTARQADLCGRGLSRNGNQAWRTWHGGAKYLVSEEGDADSIEIIHPSGERDIDRAAEILARRFHWTPATQNGIAVAARLTQVIHFIVVPGSVSDQCYPVPLVADVDSTVNITGSLTRGSTPVTHPTAVNRWIRINESGHVDTALLSTKDGWRQMSNYFVEALDGANDIEAHLTDDGEPTPCWYYRPLFLPADRSTPRRAPCDLPKCRVLRRQ